jgi:hypothetical protein
VSLQILMNSSLVHIEKLVAIAVRHDRSVVDDRIEMITVSVEKSTMLEVAVLVANHLQY